VVILSEQDGVIHTVPTEQAITIRMLASHTSGIGYIPTADRYPLLARRFEEADLFAPQQRLEGMIEKLARLPLLHQPGTTWEYSASIDVLARVVEVVSGQPFGDFIRERIFEPLEMHDTGFTLPEAEWGRVATVHTRDEEGRLVQAPETAILVRDDFKDRRHQAGGHGLMSTAGDYARFAQMLLNGGTLEGVRILSRKGAELMRMDVL
jgi:CubicO group peptidase (beta-lactamase class C family)